jgi:hypothetical protein
MFEITFHERPDGVVLAHALQTDCPTIGNSLVSHAHLLGTSSSSDFGLKPSPYSIIFERDEAKKLLRCCQAESQELKSLGRFHARLRG